VNYRALIFDDDKEIRQILWSFLDKKGYEVFAFPHPVACPLSEEKVCPCPKGQACADIILSDLNMPFQKGLDFIDEQINKGCKCKHIGLMSGYLTDEDVSKANLLGIKIFKKPFDLSELINWLDQAKKDIDPKRKLSDWFLKKLPKDFCPDLQ